MSNHLPRQTFSSSSTLPSTASRSNNYSGNESNSSSRISTGGPIIFSAGSCLRLPTTTENKKASTLYISEKEAMTWTPYPKYDDFTIGEETKQRLLESVKGSSILSIISPPGCPDLVPRSFASVEDEKHVRSQRNVPLEMLQTEMSLEDYLKDVKIDYSKVFKQCNRPPKNRAIWCNKVWAFDKVENDLEYFEVINNKFNAMVISHSTQMAPVVDRQNLPRSSSRISVLVHHRAGLQLSTRRNILDSNELVATGKELDGRLGSMQRNVAEPLKTASKTRKRDVPIVAVSPDKEANRKAPPKKKRNVSPSLNVPPAAVVVSSNGSRITKATPIPLPFSTPASNTRSHKRVLNAPSSSAVTTMIPRTNALAIAPPPLAALKSGSTVSETTSRANVSTIHPKPAPSNNRSTSRATKRCLDLVLTSQPRQRSPPASNTRSHKRVLNAPSSSAVTTMIPRTNALTIAPPPLAALKSGSTVSETTSRAIVSTIHPKPAPSNNRSTSRATKRCLDLVLTSQPRQRSPPASNTRSHKRVLNAPSSSAVTTMIPRTNALAIAPPPLAALKSGSTVSETTSRANVSTIHPKPAPSNNRSTSRATKRCLDLVLTSQPRQRSPPASNTRSHKRVLNAPSSSAVTTMIPRTNALAIAPPPLAALKSGSTVSETTSRANVSTIHPKPAPSNNRSPSQATCMSPAPGSPSRQRSPPPANTGFRQAAVQQLIQAPPPSAENINERPKRLRKPKKPFEF